MQEVDGEAFEGVSIWHGSPHSILELLVAAGGASAALQLIGWQRRGQQVAKVVVPHSGQLQVLQGREGRSVMIGFKITSTMQQQYTPSREFCFVLTILVTVDRYWRHQINEHEKSSYAAKKKHLK